MKMKNTICTLVAIAAIGGCGRACVNNAKEKGPVEGTEYVTQHDVDQVFRDEHGFRVYFDKEDGEVVEKNIS